jgi:AraC-like DNA-binding protein
MLFAGRARDLPIVNADPHLNRLLIGFCEQAIRGQRRRAPAFASMVENAIATLLPYLKEPELSISEIAWLLGFRDVGAFSHAYKRWTGRAPREARARSADSSPQTRR